MHDGMEAMDLKGKVALVTGGNGGLGQRICHALAKEGAHIAVMYARSREQAEGVARELASHYQVNAHAFACDITDDAAVHRLIGEVTKVFGRIDILINDAAYNLSIPFGDLDSLSMEVWDRIMATNLTGPMRLTKAVAPVLKAQGQGRIVNIASVAGLSPTGSSIAYAVSKAGLIHLTRCTRQLRGTGPARRHACDRQSQARAGRALRSELAPEEAGRQGRLRRHGGHHVPHRDHDRPDGGHRRWTNLSLR